jgi:hypothetical protein
MITSSLRLVLIVCTVLMAATATGYSTERTDAPQTAAIAHFPVSHHHFETVVDGTDVVYDFTVQNRGTAPLNIEKVRTG